MDKIYITSSEGKEITLETFEKQVKEQQEKKAAQKQETEINEAEGHPGTDQLRDPDTVDKDSV
jgi:hypothetical protein